MRERQRLRILFISPHLPYPPASGFRIRLYQLMRNLAERHSVSLLTYVEPSEGAGAVDLQGICSSVRTVEHAYPSGLKRRLIQLKSLPSSHSYQTRLLWSGGMQRAIAELLANEPFDIVEIHHSAMGTFDYPSHPALLLSEHNIEYELLQRICRQERWLPRKCFTWLERVKVQREEHRFWRRAAACVVTSEREAAIIRRRIANKPTFVVRNGVDLEFYAPTGLTPDPFSIVFTGLMGYRPNVDGARYFVREILPRILRARPDTVFSIVGADPPVEIRRLARPNVVVTGWVPDVRPYLERAALAVVPLRAGSGTRHKILEGLAMGKAIVSTTLGCEGLEVRDGEHLLLADEPARFARDVLRLLEDKPLAETLGRQGRSLMEHTYSWEPITRRLEAVYRAILSHDEAGSNPRPPA